MNINALLVAASLTLTSGSVLMANATTVSALTDLSKEIGNASFDLGINAAMDDDCKVHLKGFEKLRNSNIVFSLNKDTVEAYPAWPLVCSYVVTSDSVKVHDIGRGDRRLEFVRNTETTPYLSIVLQQVTEDDDATDYQMVLMNNQQTTDFNRQKIVMNMMLDYYHHVVGQ